MPEPKRLTLATLAEGALEELFQEALREVLKNLDDPNTDYKPVRKINFELGFQVDEKRQLGDVTIKTSKKLAGVKAVTTNIVIGRHQGVLMAVPGSTQNDLFSDPNPRPVAVRTGTQE